MSILCRDLWNDENGFGLYAEWSAGKAVFGHYGNDSSVQSTAVVQDGQWHYVVGTLGPTGDGRFRYRIYVDGQPDGEQIGGWAVAESPADGGILVVACPDKGGGSKPFKGDIAAVGLFDVEFSAEQVKARYETHRPH